MTEKIITPIETRTTYGDYVYYDSDEQRDGLIKFAECFRFQFLQDYPQSWFEIIVKTREELMHCHPDDPLGPKASLADNIKGSVGIKWTVAKYT